MALGLLVVACSKGSADTVSPQTYVKGICTEITDWVNGVKTMTNDMTGSITPGTAPEELKGVLGDYLDQVISATKETRDGVNAVGVPDVDNGGEVASAVVDVFDKAIGALQDARDKVDTLPSDPQAFSDATTQLGNDIQTQMGDIGSSLDALNASGLDAAAKNEPACQAMSQITSQ
jgi:hypothetical protein